MINKSAAFQDSCKSIITLSVAIFIILSAANAYAQQTPYQLNGPLVPFGDVTVPGRSVPVNISPDSRYVVYRADQDTDGVIELYSAAINGGTVTKLNAPILGGFGVRSFTISADSRFVVYQAIVSAGNRVSLFSVPITGGSPVELSVDGSTLLNVTNFSQISANSQRVAFKARDSNDMDNFYSVPITGGALIQLDSSISGNPSPLGNANSFLRLSADSKRVVFLRAMGDITELYSVPIAGGVATKLNSTLPVGGLVPGFIISPNSEQVVYTVRSEALGTSEIFSVPIAGGTPIRVSIEGNEAFGFQISPNSQRVVFRSTGIFNRAIVHSVPIAGGMPVALTPFVVLGGNASSFSISPDSQRVIIRADNETDGVFELYSATITGSSVTKLNSTLPFNSSVEFNYEISEDSSTVVYRAGQSVFGELNLYRVPIAGGTTTQLNPDAVLGGDTFNFAITPDSKQVIYRADQDTNDVFELYSLPLMGGSAVKLNSNLPFNADVDRFVISPDSRVVVYWADQDVFDETELFGVSITEEQDDFCVPIKTKNGGVALICL